MNIANNMLTGKLLRLGNKEKSNCIVQHKQNNFSVELVQEIMQFM